MANYYNLLQFLRHIQIDRQYPIGFLSSDDITLTNDGTLSDEYTSTHDKSYKFSNINYTSFQIPVRKYDTCDYLDIDVAVSEEITSSDIKIALSESKLGFPISVELECDNAITLKPNTLYKLRFTIKKTSTKLEKSTNDMGNIANITIDFPKIIESIYISDIVFRNDNYSLTLEDLDYNIQTGKDHVLAKLGMNEVPTELEFLIYKAGGAYSWLTIWQNEGKYMDDGDENSKNYYSRLLSDVDAIIESWLDRNPQVVQDDINCDVLGFTPIETPTRPHRPSKIRWRYL